MRNYSLRTRENSLQNSRYSTRRRVVVGVFFALAALYFLPGTFGALGTFFFTPLAELRTYFETSSAVLPTYVRDRNELVATIGDLTAQLAAHSGDTATIGRLTEENEELRALLGSHGETRTVAGVIGRPPMVPYDALYLDKGADDGIAEGAIVYHAEDQAIGFVSAIFPQSSLVTLFSTPGTEVTAYVFGPDVYAHGYGEGGGVIRLSIPQGITVKEGDTVVLPSIVPGTIGIVTHVVSVPTQPEQHAFVTMTTPLQSLHYVSIGKDAPSRISFEEAQARVEAHESELFMIDVPLSFMTGTASTSEATSTEGQGSE